MPTSLKGQTALVTGSGQRLGRALSEALAASGCRMILHCHSSRRDTELLAASICDSGGEAAVLRADLSKSTQTLRLARAAEKVFGGVDILINNAAVFWPTPLERLSVSQLDAFYAVNLQAPFTLATELGRAMKQRGHGAILNMACISGLKAWSTHLPYSISKAGVISMTLGLSKLLAPQVRVNAIAPGTVLPPDQPDYAEKERLRMLRKKIPLRKLGRPEDVVDAALYLLTAPFVTGQVLCVDGGKSAV